MKEMRLSFLDTKEDCTLTFILKNLDFVVNDGSLMDGFWCIEHLHFASSFLASSAIGSKCKLIFYIDAVIVFCQNCNQTADM